MHYWININQKKVYILCLLHSNTMQFLRYINRLRIDTDTDLESCDPLMKVKN